MKSKPRIEMVLGNEETRMDIEDKYLRQGFQFDSYANQVLYNSTGGICLRKGDRTVKITW